MSNKKQPAKHKTGTESSLVNVVAAQAIKGHGVTLGDDLSVHQITELEVVPLASKEKPYRFIDGSPVFHVSCNKVCFSEPDFDVRKVHLWGELEHPAIVACSYEIGGAVKFYVDTRVAGFYLLWTATRVHSDEFPGASYDLVAWMPRRKGDNIRVAGLRLVHAALLDILFVPDGEWKCKDDMSENMYGYTEVATLLGACSSTTHKSLSALNKRLAEMPEYLRPLYEGGASVTGKDSIFNC